MSERNECEACGTEENEVSWLTGEVERLKAENARLADALEQSIAYAINHGADFRLEIQAAERRAAEVEQQDRQFVEWAKGRGHGSSCASLVPYTIGAPCGCGWAAYLDAGHRPWEKAK